MRKFIPAKVRKSKPALTQIVIAIIMLSGFAYTIYTHMQSNTEDLTVSTLSYNSNYKAEIIPNNPAIFIAWYKCTLTNKGDKPLVIIDYNLTQVPRVPFDEYYSSIWYSDIDKGLFDETGKKVEFPINMQPQSSRKFTLKVGLIMNQKAFETLHNNSSLINDTTITGVNHFLAKNGMDIYGNTVINESYGYRVVSPNLTQQTFLITFNTNNNKPFTNEFDAFTWYKQEV